MYAASSSQEGGLLADACVVSTKPWYNTRIAYSLHDGPHDDIYIIFYLQQLDLFAKELTHTRSIK